MKNTNKMLKSFGKVSIIVTFLFIISFSFASLAFAQTSGTIPAPTTPGCKPGVTCIGNPFSGGNDLNALIVTILKNVIMPIAAVASVVYIIWAGFQYVMAKGNPAEISKANQNLLYALIGVGVLLGAVGISEVVQNTVKSVINLN